MSLTKALKLYDATVTSPIHCVPVNLPNPKTQISRTKPLLVEIALYRKANEFFIYMLAC